jgi:hypothetical protein
MSIIEKAYKIRNKYNRWAEYDAKVVRFTEDIDLMTETLEGHRENKFYRGDLMYWLGSWYTKEELMKHIEQNRDLLSKAAENLSRTESELAELMKAEAGL